MKQFTVVSALFLCAATPAWPWTFEETEVCTISYDDGATAVTVVFDPRSKLYAIKLSRAAGWADAPVFQLRFDGGMPFTIGTDRHAVSDDRRTLSVTDTGFGNVLKGIAANTQMTALNGVQAISVSTEGAADPIAAFQGCPNTPLS
ncbi:MAG: hypothetical protein AAFP98_05650 [Pseudomonadota bacterium]